MANWESGQYGTAVHQAPQPAATIGGMVNELIELAAELNCSMESAVAFLCTQGESAPKSVAPSQGDLAYRISVVRDILRNAITKKNTVLNALGI